MTDRQLSEIDWTNLTGRNFHPSPAAWEDQVLYFLMLDRFSDGNEKGYRGNDGAVVPGGTTEAFAPADDGNAVGTEAEAARWREAGGVWNGGTLNGLTSKLGYLKRLGVTAVWVSPVFKQVAFHPTYHGYGIQNFLDVDAHFGTREDLKEMVKVAHQNGIHVVLDIILNHSGDVFGYNPNRYPTQGPDGGTFLDPRWDGNAYDVEGFRDATGAANLPFGGLTPADRAAAWPHGAIWPTEFQEAGGFTRKGRIDNWDHDPEFREGDFFDLKDIALGQGELDGYQPSAALRALCEVYKFWIAFADIDGYRVDTVKHMDPGAARFFTAVIHEFAQSLGKENFYLIGEITGGRDLAFKTLEQTGLDAALGISDEGGKLEGLVKGLSNPEDYFNLFRNSLLVQKDSHVWFRNKVVTVLDDHDQVRKGDHKARFAADGDGARFAVAAVALQATTLGIPCIYYGTEQSFDGAGANDRYIREAMFGGDFGAFRSHDRHAFDEGGPVYKALAGVLALRRQKIALRRGRQYLREISGDGLGFGLPRRLGERMLSVVPWSRLFNDSETLLAINTDPFQPRSAWVIVDNDLHAPGDQLTCVYSTHPAEIGAKVTVGLVMDGAAKAVSVSLPAAGFVIYE